MFNYTAYRTYFENIALSHNAINHTSYKTGERGFYWFEHENLLASMKDSITQPSNTNKNPVALFLFAYESPYLDTNNGNLMRSIDASYMLLAPVEDVNGEIEICAVMTKCEEIMHQINLRIIRDANIGHPLFAKVDIDLSDFNIIPILRYHSNYYGVQCLMKFNSSNVTKCVDGSLWEDLPDNKLSTTHL